MRNARGTSGGFSPADMSTVLVMAGPAFHEGLEISVPSGIVDIAPTIAFVMGLPMAQSDGRVLLEALRDQTVTADEYTVTASEVASTVATGLDVFDPRSAVSDDEHRIAQDATHQSVVRVVTVEMDGESHRYYENAGAVRSP